jgi:protein-S-isoprenylcysteine O-methyltransferase Ste14
MEFSIYRSFAFSLAQAVIASAWILKYRSARKARKARKYSVGRRVVERDEKFRTLGKVIFILMNIVTLASFWTNAGVTLSFNQDHGFRLVGMVVLIGATVLYSVSMKYLGNNYSPFFNSHLPFEIVTNGPYTCVRHPIYLANILRYAGYVMVSGSLWVVTLGAYGVVKIMRALWTEEEHLSKRFPVYRTYQARTARLIPFIY